MIKYAHFHPDFQHVMALSGQDRIDFMNEPRWISYPQADRILNMLRGLMDKPAHQKRKNLLIVGDQNNGKNTLTGYFCDLHGQGYLNDNNEPVVPIVFAQFSPDADEKKFYLSIVEKFFTPYWTTNPTFRLRCQVIDRFRHCNVKILVVDQFHALLAGSFVKQRAVVNAMRLLCKELSILVVGTGTEDALQVLQQHMEPSSFDIVSLPLWKLDQEFQHLLVGFEKILPLKKPSRLHTPELASALHAISGGNLGNLHRLLVECASMAIENGKEQIDKHIIQEKAWLRPTRGIC